MTSNEMVKVADEMVDYLDTVWARVDDAYENYSAALDDLGETAAVADDPDLDTDEVEFYTDEWDRRMNRAEVALRRFSAALDRASSEFMQPF